MSRFEAWLDQQKQLIDAGAAASTIILEGPDGTPWGTWPIAFKDLDQSIEGIIASLRNELPRGKHPCKLLSLDTTKQQLSVFPFTLAGASEAATEGAQQALGQQRANSIMISNFEKQFEGLTKALDRMTERAIAQDEGHAKLMAHFERIEEISLKQRLDVTKEEGKQRRLDEITKGLGPALELGIGLLGEFVSDWIEKRKPSNQPPAAQKPPPPPAPPAMPPAPPNPLLGISTAAEQVLGPLVAAMAPSQPPEPVAQCEHASPETPSHEPTQSRDSGPAASAAIVRANGQGRRQGDGRRSARADGHKAPKPPQRGGH